MIKTEEKRIKIDGLRRIVKQGLISREEYYMAVSEVYKELRNEARTIVLENGYHPETQAEFMYYEERYSYYKVKEYRQRQFSAKDSYEAELQKLINTHH